MLIKVTAFPNKDQTNFKYQKQNGLLKCKFTHCISYPDKSGKNNQCFQVL